jgi:tetratricopeptide (TPR) repeat protein
MKRSERHHLKQNTVAIYADRVSTALAARGREIGLAVLLVAIAAIAIAGYTYWRNQTEARASALLAEGMIVMEAPVEPAPPPPAPGDAPPPAPASYPTEQAKLEAALPRFTEVYTQYPSAPSATVARYHAANALSALGRGREAEPLYQQVIDGGNLYAEMARLGLATELASTGQHDRAIDLLTELTSDTSGRVPVDGVLMQLARAYARAGRVDEARQAYSRVVQEFPESLYAAEARQEMEGVGKS